jgi:hypothetical protein
VPFPDIWNFSHFQKLYYNCWGYVTSNEIERRSWTMYARNMLWRISRHNPDTRLEKPRTPVTRSKFKSGTTRMQVCAITVTSACPWSWVQIWMCPAAASLLSIAYCSVLRAGILMSGIRRGPVSTRPMTRAASLRPRTEFYYRVAWRTSHRKFFLSDNEIVEPISEWGHPVELGCISDVLENIAISIFKAKWLWRWRQKGSPIRRKYSLSLQCHHPETDSILPVNIFKVQ